jgi:hypothetical protein
MVSAGKCRQVWQHCSSAPYHSTNIAARLFVCDGRMLPHHFAAPWPRSPAVQLAHHEGVHRLDEWSPSRPQDVATKAASPAYISETIYQRLLKPKAIKLELPDCAPKICRHKRVQSTGVLLVSCVTNMTVYRHCATCCCYVSANKRPHLHWL